MSYSVLAGDLFELDLTAVGHGCNCRGSMAGGIAREFRDRYPEMYLEYAERCDRGEFRLGDIFAWNAADVVVYNLATQQEPGADARLEAIGTAIHAALADAAGRGLPKLGVPRIGAGIGGLSWPDVSEVLRQAGELSPVDLVAVTRPGDRRERSR